MTNWQGAPEPEEIEARRERKREQTPTAEERRQFEEAHAQGLHDTAPREFCPACEALSPHERDRRWECENGEEGEGGGH